MKPKYLNNDDKWMLAEHIPDCDIFFFQIPASCFTSDTSYPFILKYKKFIATLVKFDLNFYYGEKNSFAVAESILKALIDRPAFGRELNQNIVKWSKKLIQFTKKVERFPLERYSKKQLWELYKEHDTVHTKLYTYGWLPVCVDMFHGNMTNRLKQYLRTVCHSAAAVEEAFVVLTTPTHKTIVAQDREEFLKIYQRHHLKLKKIKKGTNIANVSSGLRKALEKHAQHWGHFGYIFAGNHSPFSGQHYLDEMIDLVLSKVHAAKLLKQDDEYLKTARAKKVALYRKIKINQTYKQLFETAAEFSLTKLVRRHAQLYTILHLHRTLLTEIAKRLKLTRYEVQFMLLAEVKTALLNNKIQRAELKSRLKSCVYYTEKNLEVIYTGPRTKKMFAMMACGVAKDIKEIFGQTAQPGKARGAVKIIIRAKDMAKMKRGDVLVSIATDPDIVPAMKKAAAIVTEQGGITSHAAIVSRELGIPCVIGTKIATRVLKDGDVVEVDAEKGVVKKL